MGYGDDINLSVLLGKTLTNIVNDGGAELRFVCSNGAVYEMYHDQSCCESVYLDEVIGDLNDLIGEPITLAEEASSDGVPPKRLAGFDEDSDYATPESYTWTFYKLATRKGYVDLRWYGTSNGYYSESVNFKEVSKATEEEGW